MTSSDYKLQMIRAIIDTFMLEKNNKSILKSTSAIVSASHAKMSALKITSEDQKQKAKYSSPSLNVNSYYVISSNVMFYSGRNKFL